MTWHAALRRKQPTPEQALRLGTIDVAAQKMPLTFEAFEQAEASTTRNHGGTSLGLAIAKRLAGLMDRQAGAGAAVADAGLACLPRERLMHAATGIEDLCMVHAERPDFTLLNTPLGDMSGPEVVRRISEEVALRHLQVTIITGVGFSMDVIKAMSLGAFEYWIKPVDPQVLEAGVRRALTCRRADPAHTMKPG